jgi:hypothetical protein
MGFIEWLFGSEEQKVYKLQSKQGYPLYNSAISIINPHISLYCNVKNDGGDYSWNVITWSCHGPEHGKLLRGKDLNLIWKLMCELQNLIKQEEQYLEKLSNKRGYFGDQVLDTMTKAGCKWILWEAERVVRESPYEKIADVLCKRRLIDTYHSAETPVYIAFIHSIKDNAPALAKVAKYAVDTKIRNDALKYLAECDEAIERERIRKQREAEAERARRIAEQKAAAEKRQRENALINKYLGR